MKRIILCLLAFLLILPVLGGCGKGEEPDAIIILPGIMGSEMFLAEDAVFKGKTYAAGTKLWVDIDSLSNVFAVPEHIEMMALDSGCSVRPHEPIVNEYVVQNTYGALNTYAKLYKAIYEEFRDACDVVFYSYDWRYDPFEAARDLDAYIASQGYEKVSLVVHSMGGLVASQYLAMGEAQRDRVVTYLSLGTPYLGAEQASYVMATGNINTFFANILVSDEAKALCPTLDSMYTLMPFSRMWRSSLSIYPLIGNAEASRSFEHEQVILGTYIESYNRSRHADAEDRKALYFTEDGRHVTQLVNAYYLVGDGVNTVTTVSFPKNEKIGSSLCLPVKTARGDGTVSLYSATVGGTLPADRTFIKSPQGNRLADHNSLASGDDPTNLDFVLAVLRGEIDSLSAFELKSRYNVQKGAPAFD